MGNWESFVADDHRYKEEEVEPADFSPLLLAKYEPERKIGKGAFGAVFLVREKSSGALYCAKRVKNEARNTMEVRL